MLHPSFKRPAYSEQFDKHILNYEEEGGGFEFEVVHENVVYMRYTGVLSEALANRSNECMIHILDVMKQNDVDPNIHFINDMSDTEYSEFKAYRIMRNHADRYFGNGCYRFNALISDHMLVKMYVKLSNRYRRTPQAGIFPSPEAAAAHIAELIQEDSVPRDPGHSTHDRMKSSPWAFWKWPSRVKQLEKENAQLQRINEERYAQLMRGVKSILFEDDDVQVIPKNESNPRLQEIYRQISMIRMEIQVSLDELKRNNENLERIIRERIAKDRKSRAFLLSSIEQSTDQVWSFDLNWNYLFFNKAHEQACEHKPAVGMSIEDSLPKALTEEISKRIESLKQGHTQVVELTDKHGRRVAATLSPVRENQKVIGVTALSHDISDQFARETLIKNQEAEVSALMNSTEDFMLSVDENFNLVKANDTFTKLLHKYLGRRPEKGESLSELMDLPQDLSLDHMGKQVMLGESVRQILPMSLRGNLFFVDTSFSPIRDVQGKVSGVAISARDVTGMRKTQEELKDAKNRADEMVRLKSNFLASMSHEIRTPINGIMTAAQLMKEYSPSDEMRGLLDLQVQSGNRLLTTINSLLHLSQLESTTDRTEYKEVDVGLVLRECVAEVKLLAQSKNLELDYTIPEEQCSCLAAEYILNMVLMNLLSNAVKYTDKGCIRTYIRANEENVEIVVEDTGIGIPEDNLEGIFKPYNRQESTDDREGTGLGLNIVTRYVELLGGNIFVESKENVGSKFTVVLPRYERKA